MPLNAIPFSCFVVPERACWLYWNEDEITSSTSGMRGWEKLAKTLETIKKDF